MQEFSGVGTATTGLFKVQNRWEVRWNARQVVSVAVMSSDGIIIAGAAGVLRGSLFVPQGGQFYFKISDGTTPAPAATDTNKSAPSAADSGVSWHLQVVQLEKNVTSDQALTVYTPYFIVPDSAITPVAPLPKPPPPVLTADQTHAVVRIQGDNAEGTGFLMRSPEGTFVATHLHLLAANPNIKIFTTSGVPITILSLKGATDRDLALFTIQDNHFSYLPLPANSATSFQVGDELIIPEIGQETEVLPGVPGKVISASPLRLDFDNVIHPGHTGAPVIHVKSGAVLAMVTDEKPDDLSDTIAKAWAGNPAPGSAGIIPFFGLRLTDVPGWETYDLNRFLAETLFLKQFHEDTRCLDSYLNGKRHSSPDEDTPPVRDNQYFLNNDKIRQANETYHQFASDGDQNQRLDATRELLFDLQGIADTGVSTLQSMSLYAYDQTWAKEELAYRKALRAELDDLGNNIHRLDNIARP